MKKKSVILSALGALASMALFIHSQTMSVSLPGAKVVNIHLMQQQEQLFLISLLGLVVSIFFLAKGWRQRGSELVQDAEEFTEQGKASLRKNFLTLRMLVILLVGAAVFVLASEYASYRELEQARANYAECMTYPHGDTEEAKEAHRSQCLRASYLN